MRSPPTRSSGRRASSKDWRIELPGGRWRIRRRFERRGSGCENRTSRSRVRSRTPKSSSSAAPMRDVAYIALGSNLGYRERHLARAREAIDHLPATRLVAASSVEETDPLGGLDQPAYLNQMVAVETSLTPRELLDRLHALEK